MKLLDLFSGIGGFSLAASWAGIETVQFVEFDGYCQKVLNKNFPGVPIHGDIKTFKVVRGSADIISGGFPCQPFSVAGKQRGTEDDRALWPEMFRIIKEVRPTWVLGENVTGIVNMELDNVLANLESEGYETQTFIIPACAVNAKHRRNRVWIVGNSNSVRMEGTRTKQQTTRISGRGENVADTNTKRVQRRTITGSVKESRKNSNQFFERRSKTNSVWPAEPNVGRVAHGVPGRVDRLKGLGNAIVPQVAYEIFRSIVLIEKGEL
jgi:DNA (cytosine-5)-methyltransferase 1